MTCPCCTVSATCSGSVTFAITNFSSQNRSNGQSFLGTDSPNGVYTGSLLTVENQVGCMAEAVSEQFTLGGRDTNADCRVPDPSVPVQPGPYRVYIAAGFVHPVTGFCNSPLFGMSCGLQIRMTGRLSSSGLGGGAVGGFINCTQLLLFTNLASSTFTVAQLNEGVSLTHDNFRVINITNYLASWTLSFDFFMQRNPLP